jgi:hypothetical protein
VRGNTKTQAGMRQVTLQTEALAALLDQQTLNGAAEIVFHNPRTNQPWHNDQAIRKNRLDPGPATRQCQIPHPLLNPPHLRFHAAVTRRKSPMGRQPNGPQGLGYDQKSLWTMDCLAIVNLRGVPKISKYPPAKPGALVREPLKAAKGSLTRPQG